MNKPTLPKLTQAQRRHLIALLGEGIHTGFRKATSGLQAEATALREALAQADRAVAYFTGHDLDTLVDRLALESLTGGQPPTGGQ